MHAAIALVEKVVVVILVLVIIFVLVVLVLVIVFQLNAVVAAIELNQAAETESSPPIDYITYGALEHGSAGLVFWKRKALFFPHHTEIVRTALPPDFNEEEYLSLNPDVAQIGDVPAWHYQHHGAREGRKYRKEISSTMSE
jgi:hypothetical protein